jgi:hypothetical protein
MFPPKSPCVKGMVFSIVWLGDTVDLHEVQLVGGSLVNKDMPSKGL